MILVSIDLGLDKDCSNMSKHFIPRVISSANGLGAVARAYAEMQAGADPLDAVIAGVSLVEDDPQDLTVGYGGLPNEDGVVELDAAVMHGPTHRAGAVAAIQGVRHPSRVAQLVMQMTDHVLLVGEGARRFAMYNGFVEENLLTEKARKIWMYWKRTRSLRDDWIAPAMDDVDSEVREFFRLEADDVPGTDALVYQRSEALERPTGTIHCSAINHKGDISCTTTTSGLAFKIAGRVGDSAVIGAGLYCDNEVGSCGSTGRGEANLQHASSASAVELMRQGATPLEAGRELLRRVVAHTREPHLLGKDGKPNFGLKLYLQSKSGQYAGVSLWGPTEYAVADAQGARLEPCEFLFDKRADKPE